MLNTLTQADVLEEDMLFATLDPTTRTLELPGKQKMLLTDTVGFIRKLPHHLIEAFRSTLEEAKYADFILHVVDASNPHMEQQMHTVYETLERLEIKDKPVITLFNKQDKAEELYMVRDFHAERTVRISARTGEGLEELKTVLEELIRNRKVYFEGLIVYTDAGKIQQIRQKGELLKEDYQPEGIYVQAYVSKELYQKLV